jgi:hypothetical protein
VFGKYPFQISAGKLDPLSNTYRVSEENLKGRESMVNVDVEGRIINWILEEKGAQM